MTTILDHQDGKLVLVCSDRLIDLVKQVPGYKFDYKEDNWKAPASPLTVNATWEVFQGVVDPTSDLLAYMEKVKHNSFTWGRIAAGEYREDDDGNEDLWLPQRDGVQFLSHVKLAYLCDEMGAGKTAQSLRALENQAEFESDSPFPALVVCNKSAMHNWPDEVDKWTPDIKVYVIDGTTKKREELIAEARTESEAGQNVVIVINWEALHTSGTGRKHTRLAAYGGLALSDIQKTDGSLNGGWIKSVIADEAHKAKSWRSTRTRALWSVAHEPQVINRWAITGTPLTGAYEDLWAIGHFVDPDSFPLKTKFMDRYTVQTVGYHGGLVTHGWNPAHEEELMSYFKTRFLRRTKRDMRGSDYLGKLPPVVRTVRMEGKQKTAYNRMKKEMLAEDEGAVFAAGSDVELHIRLGQFSAGTPVIEDVEGVMRITGLQKPSCKLNALMEILAEAGDQQLVVFSESRLLLTLVASELSDKGYTYGEIHGNIGGLERQASVEAFQAGNLQLMLCSYAAGAESINLNSAHHLVRLQWTNNYVHWKQAPDRLDRGDQNHWIQITDIVTEGAAEHVIHENIDAKGKLARSLDDPDFQKELLNA